MEVLHQIWEAIRTGSLPDLGVWSYLILFILIFVEGPAVTLIAGAMAASGLLEWPIVLIVAILGNFLADVLWYVLGYAGAHHRFLYRFQWMRRRRPMIRRLQDSMKDHGVRLYLMTKLSLGMMTIPVLIAAGLARVRWLSLAVVSLFVEPVWNGLLVFAGYRLGGYIGQMERGLRYFSLIGAVVMLLIFIAVYRRIFQRVIQAGTGDSIH